MNKLDIFMLCMGIFLMLVGYVEQSTGVLIIGLGFFAFILATIIIQSGRDETKVKEYT